MSGRRRLRGIHDETTAERAVRRRRQAYHDRMAQAHTPQEQVSAVCQYLLSRMALVRNPTVANTIADQLVRQITQTAEGLPAGAPMYPARERKAS